MSQKINRNQAKAKEVSDRPRNFVKEAAAILHYREEKGDFKTIDDLKKVPGVECGEDRSQKEPPCVLINRTM